MIQFLTEEEINAQVTPLLSRRLISAAQHLLPNPSQISALAREGNGILATQIAREVIASGHLSNFWLLFVTFTSVFPDIDRVKAFARSLRLAAPDRLLLTLLEETWDDAARWSQLDVDMEIVTDRVVVDVNFCALNDYNTGVQRVVRETMARWSAADRPIELVCWADNGTSLRTLTPLELRRVTDWNALQMVPRSQRKNNAEQTAVCRPKFIVPFGTTVIFPEIPLERLGGQLSALAACSGNRVGMIGYDAIPVVSPEYVSEHEIQKFLTFLKIVKHVHRIAGISESASGEFEGYSEALIGQGIKGAEVFTVPLPVEVPAEWRKTPYEQKNEPLILVVGSFEPRKNHFSILFAAEQLWSQGFHFVLRFIGNGGNTSYCKRFTQTVQKLKKRGRRIEVFHGGGDYLLAESYRRAFFTVFPSLHEGFGLPVAESLSLGVPVVTSQYGSTAEIAAHGGCVTVDPRDNEDLVRGMRLLLENPQERERLAHEALSRSPYSWDDYAVDLWDHLVEPLREKKL